MTARQLPLPFGRDAESTLENFLPGANVAVVSHLRTLAMPAAPIYLWGPQGSGKTHLLASLVDSARRSGQGVAVFDAGSAAPWQIEPGLALATLDDCDALDEPSQQEAFRLFVQAQAHGIQLAAAGRVPPVDLPLREDLRTRLGWGDVFALVPLAEPQVRTALRCEFERRGIPLGDDVLDFLLNRFARDLKHLLALLDRLDTYALACKRAVSLALLRRMLDEEGAACD